MSIAATSLFGRWRAVTQTALQRPTIPKSPGNQGKHRVTKRRAALSNPMFTLVTSVNVKKNKHYILTFRVCPPALCFPLHCQRRPAGKQSGDVTAVLSGCPALTASAGKHSAGDRHGSEDIAGSASHTPIQRCLQEDTAPPLPERNCYLDEDDADEQIYAKTKKETNGNPCSPNTNKDVHYSHVKERQINKKNVVKTNPQNVLYSEVKLDHSVPSALAHLHGSPQALNQEALKLSADRRKPKLISNLNECEVLEMRFATSIQTVNSKTSFLHAGPESPDSSFLFPTALSNCEADETYAEIPFRDPHYMNEYHAMDKIANFSMCTTNTFDHVSTRTSKEFTSREMNRKVANASIAQDNAYETISRDITQLAVRKQNAAKVEKPKRFFFGDKKK
ncbi:unnamed protein product [Ranitomeya imitator]|uniref:Uncharacterized protein n=1 Tax=Ranitomeya imitator TaxID=111125 RepID=A0ABN9MJG1_9NEOB|nr:unnamed protein product [Ranitomeya imitator]